MDRNQTPNNHRPPMFGDRANIGAKEVPFSGVGEEYHPLGPAPRDSGVLLHEAGYWPGNYDWNFTRVYSPFWRLLYDYEPGHFVCFGDNAFPLGPNEIFVIPNQQIFDSRGDAAVASLWFTFTCARQADPHQQMPIRLKLDPVSAAFVGEFSETFQDRSAGRRDRIFQMSLSFVLYCLSRPVIEWQPPVPDEVRLVIEAIDNDPARKWNNAELAALSGLSKDHFVRVFRHWTGSTPGQRVIQVRLREACQQLSSTEQSIEAIASACGFSDRFHLSRVLKKITGVTPASYRRIHRR